MYNIRGVKAVRRINGCERKVKKKFFKQLNLWQINRQISSEILKKNVFNQIQVKISVEKGFKQSYSAS